MQQSEHPTEATLARNAMICAVIGTTLAVILGFLKCYKSLMAWVTEAFSQEPFYLEAGQKMPWVHAILALFLALMVAYVVLDNSPMLQRLVVLIVTVALVVGSVFVVAMLGGIWLPIVELVAIVWAWLCACLWKQEKSHF